MGERLEKLKAMLKKEQERRIKLNHPMTLVRDEKSLSGTVRYKYMMLILRTYNGASRRRNLPIKP